MEIGLSPRQQNQWEFAQIAESEVDTGTVGASARFKTCRFRAKW
jgi:hypothetical protein